MAFDQPSQVLRTDQAREARSVYSIEQRKQVAATYLSTGSLRKTAEVTGVPLSTVHGWSHSDWWQTTIDNLRTQYRAELEARVTAILFDSLEQAQDRLNYGDVTVLKDGCVVRHAMKARDLALMIGIMFDKRQLLRHAPMQITNGDQRLIGLAERLAKLATEKVVTPSQPAQVTDAERGTEL